MLIFIYLLLLLVTNYEEFDNKKDDIHDNINFDLNLAKFGDLKIVGESLVYNFPKFLKEDEGFLKCEYYKDFVRYIFDKISFDIDMANI